MNASASSALLALVLAASLAGCTTNGGDDNPYRPADEVSYPDTLIAIVPTGGGAQKNPPILLINRTNQKYLQWEEGVAIPKFVHPYFSKNPYTAWAVMPNEDMKVLIDDSLVPEGLFDVTTPIAVGNLSVPGWPTKAAVLVEQGDRVVVLYDVKERGPDGKALNNRLAPDEERPFKLFTLAKTCLVTAINQYPGVNQMTQRGQGGRNPDQPFRGSEYETQGP